MKNVIRLKNSLYCMFHVINLNHQNANMIFHFTEEAYICEPMVLPILINVKLAMSLKIVLSGLCVQKPKEQYH